MENPTAQRYPTLRFALSASAQPPEIRVLRELTDYQGDREIVGTTLLEVAKLSREAHLLTLNDGEHLLLLIQGQRACYWEPSRESLESLRQRACDWLTEPASSAR